MNVFVSKNQEFEQLVAHAKNPDVRVRMNAARVFRFSDYLGAVIAHYDHEMEFVGRGEPWEVRDHYGNTIAKGVWK